MGGVGGGAWSSGSCFVFSFSRFTKQTAMIIIIIVIIIILITIILIIVTCIHSIFVERQQEEVPPTYYNKGPDSTDDSGECVYMLTFIYEFNKRNYIIRVRYLVIK